jgi:TolB-like protein/DNA-binding winged helix-turn-helix (wHTH) protein
LTRSDGTVLKVSGKPFDVLVYLVRHAGDVVDRSKLLQAVWRKRVVEENNVNQAIAELRRVLGAEHIVTVAGQGYQFVTPARAVAPEQVVEPPGSRAEEAAAANGVAYGRSDGAVESTTSALGQLKPTTRSRVPFLSRAWSATAAAATRLRHVAPAMLVVLVVAGALLVIDWSGPVSRSTDRRIAVLPCDNLSPDPNDSYFAPGIHEELLNRLAQIRGLRVISRSSVLRYANDRPPIPEIGAALAVDTIMECSVRYYGNQVMLTVQLIDVATDEHTWSRSYPADMSDLRSLYQTQADIAGNVAEALRVELADEEREQIAAAPTESREAYELYLASMAAPRGSDRGIELLDQALRLDPRFIEAWIRKAGLHIFNAGIRAGADADAQWAKALEAVHRALELDPDSAGAHAALASYFGQTGDLIGAEEEWRRAFALGFPPGGDMLLKLSVGHISDAVKAMEASLLKNPLDEGARSMLLIAYEVLGDKAARRRHWDRGEELSLSGSWMGDATEPGLRLGEGDIEFVRAAEMRHAGGRLIWSAGVANLDSPADGLAAMRSLYANPDLRNGGGLRGLTEWALHFGDPALALQWFRESLEFEATGMLNAWKPSFAPLRREAGFKDLVRDQKLPEYWKRFGWPEFCRPMDDDDFDCD